MDRQVKRIFWTLLIFCIYSLGARAHSEAWKNEQQLAVLFGVTQPLVLSGFNIEGTYIYERFIVAYSHGVSLDFNGRLLPEYLQEQSLVVHMPFSTGIGVGYRFTEWLNVRLESKWHRFEFYYDGDDQNSINRIATDAYNFSMGVGAYGLLKPFKHRSNMLQGITLAPSVRYWPTVASSFTNGRTTYENTRTGETETLKALSSGIGFSPWIVNLSIGYSF